MKRLTLIALSLIVCSACGKRVGVSSDVTPKPTPTLDSTGTNAEPMPTPEPMMSPHEYDAEPIVTPTVNPKQQQVQQW